MSLDLRHSHVHICGSRVCGEPILPITLRRSKFTLCLHGIRIRNSFINTYSDFAQYISHEGLPYYTNNYTVTRNDCTQPRILAVVTTAEAHIRGLMLLAGINPQNCDIVIDVRCTSTRSPEYRYYVADHVLHKIHWPCGERQEILDQRTAVIRSCAEYWRHIATFPSHRLCMPEDLHDAQQLLNRFKTRELKSVFGTDEQLDIMITTLGVFNEPSNMINMNATFSIAKINCLVAETQISYYYNSFSVDGCPKSIGLLGTLFGFFTSRPRSGSNCNAEHMSHCSGSSESSNSDSESSVSGSYHTALSSDLEIA